MNLFSGLSAFGFRFRDQREQTAEGDGGGDAAGRTGHAAGEHVERGQADERGGVAYDDTGVLHADEGNEQADTGGDSDLDGLRDGVEDDLAEAGDGQQDEDDTVDEDHDQRIGIRQPHANADRVDEVSVQAHAGRLRERQVGQQTDGYGADDGGDGSCDVDRTITDTENVRSIIEGV